MDTCFVVILGERFSGKSTVGRLLREKAGVGSAADLEFSDLMIEGANFALDRRARSHRRFPENLFAGSLWVTGEDAKYPGLNWFWKSQSERKEHQALLRGLDQTHPSGLRLDRQNKIRHLPLLIWQGYFLRQPDMLGPEVWGRRMASNLQKLSGRLPLVTVAGARDPGDVSAIETVLPNVIKVKVWRDEVTGDIDPTNRHHHRIVPDADIYNNGTVRELAAAVHNLYGDITSGRFQHTLDKPWYNYPPVRVRA